jgi:hypothetical protein
MWLSLLLMSAQLLLCCRCLERRSFITGHDTRPGKGRRIWPDASGSGDQDILGALRDACAAEGESPIPRDEFDDANAADILRWVRLSQPRVFARLERTRAGLWAAPTRFDGGCTLLCLTHKAAQREHGLQTGTFSPLVLG